MILTRPDTDTIRLDIGTGSVCWCYRVGGMTRYASAGADAVLSGFYNDRDGTWPEVSKDGVKRDVPNLLPAVKRLFAQELKKENADADRD